ncbi:KDO2-lipid IV(A) lauroyltransferase [Friedmanniella endophytica]|uniref:KDO2-lipid IV(A) lauroyltransferase n=1 Tax=Microlunatus kandeliicorticis TaxID=1759536 RepID=A0A7W3ITF9_9ACTN|nr:phosphatidylinositol mannoside acyltransferase [Microlunatus kandeliicorticis]MBA8794942.1 KDO2-lipid IV(A) lauroyltransferase [Microlunatus kandeliicorticis]
MPDRPTGPSGPGGRDLYRRGLAQLYGLGWRIGPHLPDTSSPRVSALLDRVAGGVLARERRRGSRYPAQLAENLELATGAPADPELLRRAYASYLRTLWEVMNLPGWTPAQVQARVRTTGEDTLRRAFAQRGAVVALPHSANWDLAGAWSCGTGMPVTTVAEAFLGPGSQGFTAFRHRLGMRVLDHSDRQAIAELVGDARGRRLVCLVADRDLTGSGLPVRWGRHRVSLPAGPAVVARRSGAALVPAVCRYDTDEPGVMWIDFGAEIPAEPGRAGLVAMTQQVADFFAARIARAPQDWHLLQPFFAAAEPGGPSPAVRTPAGSPVATGRQWAAR